MIQGWESFNEKWSNTKKDMINTGFWNDGVGAPKFYEAFAKEVEGEIATLSEDISFWKERKEHNRDDYRLRVECQEIIKALVKEKEIILWKVKGFLKCGLKLKRYLEKEKIGASQNSPRD